MSPSLPPAHGWRRDDLRAWLARGPARPWAYDLSSGHVVDAQGRRLARVLDADTGLLLVLLANAAEPLLADLDRTEENLTKTLDALYARDAGAMVQGPPNERDHAAKKNRPEGLRRLSVQAYVRLSVCIAGMARRPRNSAFLSEMNGNDGLRRIMFSLRLLECEAAWLIELARRGCGKTRSWHVSKTDVIRSYIRDKALAEGIATPAEVQRAEEH